MHFTSIVVVGIPPKHKTKQIFLLLQNKNQESLLHHNQVIKSFSSSSSSSQPSFFRSKAANWSSDGSATLCEIKSARYIFGDGSRIGTEKEEGKERNVPVHPVNKVVTCCHPLHLFVFFGCGGEGSWDGWWGLDWD